MRASGWGFLIVALLLGPGAAAQFQDGARARQMELAARQEPTPFEVQGRIVGEAPAVFRVRFYADADFRGGSGARWQDRMRAQLGMVNEIIAPAFGVRLEAESFRRWDRTGPSGALEPLLLDLKSRDPGTEVDWVVGLVAPLPLVSLSFHDLGRAEVLGRHFVLRSMTSAAEFNDFRRVFSAIEPEILERLYGARKQHKEIAIFLHEWAHTLGLPHASHPSRLMAAGYSPRTGVLNELEVRFLGESLAIKRGGRGPVDWRPLERLVKAHPNDWRSEERQDLLRLLALRLSGAQRPGHPALRSPAEEPPTDLPRLPRPGLPKL